MTGSRALPILLLLTTNIFTWTESTRAANVSDGYLESCGPDQTIILRKKRFLTFPPRSEILFRISLLKSTPWKTVVFTIHEIDVQIPIPENPHAIIFGTTKHRNGARSRNDDLLTYYPALFLRFLGFNGKACIDRFLCELSRAKSYFRDRYILLQVLTLIYRPNMNQTCETCQTTSCPISLVPEFMMDHC